MRRTAGLVSGRSLVLRLLLVVALGAGLSAMHVLAAVVGHQPTAGPASGPASRDTSGHMGSSAVGAQMPMSGASAPTGIPSRTHETTQVAAYTTAQVASAIAAQVRTQAKAQVGDHAHHAMGECVLFLSAGIALVVVLLAWIAAQALRPWYWLTRAWPRRLIATTPWRGPPPRHWPRISLCVIRV